MSNYGYGTGGALGRSYRGSSAGVTGTNGNKSRTTQYVQGGNGGNGGRGGRGGSGASSQSTTSVMSNPHLKTNYDGFDFCDVWFMDRTAKRPFLRSNPESSHNPESYSLMNIRIKLTLDGDSIDLSEAYTTYGIEIKAKQWSTSNTDGTTITNANNSSVLGGDSGFFTYSGQSVYINLRDTNDSSTQETYIRRFIPSVTSNKNTSITETTIKTSYSFVIKDSENKSNNDDSDPFVFTINLKTALSGNGTFLDPYRIYNAHDLMAGIYNTSNVNTSSNTKFYKQMNNFTVSKYYTRTSIFKDVYNGNGYKITVSSNSFSPLFGENNYGIINNLDVEYSSNSLEYASSISIGASSSDTLTKSVGGIVSVNYGTIKNVNVTMTSSVVISSSLRKILWGNFTGRLNVYLGVIAGENKHDIDKAGEGLSGKILECNVMFSSNLTPSAKRTNLSGTNNATIYFYFGGIVGRNLAYSIVDSCYFGQTSISSSPSFTVTGKSATNPSNTTANTYIYFGAIAYSNSGTLSNCLIDYKWSVPSMTRTYLYRNNAFYYSGYSSDFKTSYDYTASANTRAHFTDQGFNFNYPWVAPVATNSTSAFRPSLISYASRQIANWGTSSLTPLAESGLDSTYQEYYTKKYSGKTIYTVSNRSQFVAMLKNIPSNNSSHNVVYLIINDIVISDGDASDLDGVSYYGKDLPNGCVIDGSYNTTSGRSTIYGIKLIGGTTNRYNIALKNGSEDFISLFTKINGTITDLNFDDCSVSVDILRRQGLARTTIPAALNTHVSLLGKVVSGHITNVDIDCDVNLFAPYYNARVSGAQAYYVGNAISYSSSGTITGIKVSGNSTMHHSNTSDSYGETRLGGLVGYTTSSNISQVASLVNVSMPSGRTGMSYTYVGGLVGYMDNGTLTDSYYGTTSTTFNVYETRNSSNNYVGVFGGRMSGTISRCYAYTSTSYSNYSNNTVDCFAKYLSGTLSELYTRKNRTGMTDKYSDIKEVTSTTEGLAVTVLPSSFDTKLVWYKISNTSIPLLWIHNENGRKVTATSDAGVGKYVTAVRKGSPLDNKTSTYTQNINISPNGSTTEVVDSFYIDINSLYAFSNDSVKLTYNGTTTQYIAADAYQMYFVINPGKESDDTNFLDSKVLDVNIQYSVDYKVLNNK